MNTWFINGFREFTPVITRHFWVFNNHLDWTEAKAYCEEKVGTQFARVTSEVLHDEIYNITQANTWVGITDANKEGVWLWAYDDTPVTYFNWEPGQPNNAQQGQNCVSMHKQAGGKWADFRCKGWSEPKFACERRKMSKRFSKDF